MNKIIELTLDGMAHGGAAIGRHEGRAIFVPYGIPGERVRVELINERDRYAHARLVEVLDASPARIEPDCPHFGEGKCGGCQWQHIAYPVQTQLKGMVVVDQFKRVGKFDPPPVLDPIPDASGWGYRNHAMFRVDEEGKLGFLSTGSHDVHAVDDCPILHPLLRDLKQSLDMAYPELEWMEMRAGTATGELMLLIQAKEEESPALHVDFPLSIVQIRHDDAVAPLIGLDYFNDAILDKPFRVSATSFFQVNTEQAGTLVNLVLDALDVQSDELVLDAYCGGGLFSTFLAPLADGVVGIEVSSPAVEDALFNLESYDNIEILEGTVEDVLADRKDAFDAIVVDPPRTGLDRAALDWIAASSASRMAYVSCDPATLARDCRRLVDHGWTLQWVQPVDMFPQTYHIENVALLTHLED